MTAVQFIALVWLGLAVVVLAVLEEVRRRPITPTDEALARADAELDRIEAERRRAA